MNNLHLDVPIAYDKGVFGRLMRKVDELIDRAYTRPKLKSFTVAELPATHEAGMLIYVSNAAGGAQPAFSDGTDWRRFTDRAVVS